MIAWSAVMGLPLGVLQVVRTDAEDAPQRQRHELRRHHHVCGDLVRGLRQRQDRRQLRPAAPVGQPGPVDHRHDRHHAEVVLVAVGLDPLAFALLEVNGPVGQVQGREAGFLVHQRIGVLVPAQRRGRLPGAGVDLAEHLERRLERHEGRVVVVLVRADRDVRAAHHQRVDMGHLRLLVAAVFLPDAPQVVVAGVVGWQPEPFDVEALLEGVDDELRPRDHDLLQPVADFPHDLRVHIHPRRAQLVLVVQRAQVPQLEVVLALQAHDPVGVGGRQRHAGPLTAS
jgi:hypothetical protein